MTHYAVDYAITHGDLSGFSPLETEWARSDDTRTVATAGPSIAGRDIRVRQTEEAWLRAAYCPVFGEIAAHRHAPTTARLRA